VPVEQLAHQGDLVALPGPLRQAHVGDVLEPLGAEALFFRFALELFRPIALFGRFIALPGRLLPLLLGDLVLLFGLAVGGLEPAIEDGPDGQDKQGNGTQRADPSSAATAGRRRTHFAARSTRPARRA
jgi:hypothetical protein